MKGTECTYRIQFHADFTFDDAAKLIDYFHELGITHIYASPCLKARPGSNHGYDVVDHNSINPEIGGEKGFIWLEKRLKEKQMGLVLDIVPNHMAVSGAENRWWWDVLENGPSSLYSSYFDVDWEFPPELPRNKILLPILGDHYGRVIEAGDIYIQRRDNDIIVRYFEHFFPSSPKSLINILHIITNKIQSDELGFIISALRYLPPPSITDRVSMKSRNRDKGVLINLLNRIMKEQPHIRKLIDEEIENINTHPDKLDIFLEKQNYRLAYWKTARTDLGYRRFFDINSYIGLRIEDQIVFEDTHDLIISLIKENKIHGLRIDHPDGLLDPEGYFRLLREKAGKIWIVVEKILHPDEQLQETWPVDGTTGYDFMNLVSGVFINTESEKLLSSFYNDFSGEHGSYADILYNNKKKIMKKILASDIHRLSLTMLKICENNRCYRDYSKNEVIRALEEYIAWLNVYRTYTRIGDCPVAKEDAAAISDAIERAKKHKPEIDSVLFDFLKDILTCRSEIKEQVEFAMQLQQITGSVMAKGAEDTTFYCCNRFLMLNEVGSDPGTFGLDAGDFHKKQELRSRTYPHSMLSTSTHDTKRSEDVRARLAVISEIPDKWKEFVEKSAQNNAKYKKDNKPDKNMEYHLYQTIAGAWPLSEDRLTKYAEKAAREAKVYTSWFLKDKQYEEALKEFIISILHDEVFNTLIDTIVSEIIYPGRINSLSQVLLKLASPGIPDIYQGTELWDLSLVDPDNRRPVDFELRKKLLREMEGMNTDEILKRMDQGLPKLWIIRKTLTLRNSYPELFSGQPYIPLEPAGSHSRHIIAFSRGEDLVVIVPRMIKSMNSTWTDTEVKIPEGIWSGVLDGKEYSGPVVKAKDLFDAFPVSLLIRREKIS